jgi:ribosomal protein S18 acetylase RimI-like enzyme
MVTCLCGQRVEADDTEALVAAYRAHNAGQHAQLQVPEERWAELETAIRRSGGWDGQRERIVEPIELRPLTPDLKDEYIAYFDAPAFADNPVWSNCYCLSYHEGAVENPMEAHAGRSRRDRAAMIERGEASGVLAYAGARIVGWCNASPRTSLPLLDLTPEFAADEPERTAAIVCYVIAPQYRGQGLARRLLGGAIEMMRGRGFRWLDAYPPKDPRSDAASYHGKLEMYLDAGFERVRENARHVVVRREL